MSLLFSNDAAYDYNRTVRHWDPRSEKFAGGDALLTATRKGWKPCDTVYREDHWLAGSRLVTIYVFELERGDERMEMPVITNPYVRSMLLRSNNNVVSTGDRPALRARAGGSRGGE
jgi:hypothetical protein